VTGVIVLNILIMASESYAQPEWWSHTVMSINVVFIFIYCIELFIRFFAYLHLFFLDPWNIFDLLVVLSSIIELSLVNQGTSPPLPPPLPPHPNHPHSSNPTLVHPGGAGLSTLRTLRLLKVLRTLRLVRRMRRLRQMMNSLVSCVPPILSSMVFLLLFIFLVAVLGVSFFSGVREGYGIHRRNNFNTCWKVQPYTRPPTPHTLHSTPYTLGVPQGSGLLVSACVYVLLISPPLMQTPPCMCSLYVFLTCPPCIDTAIPVRHSLGGRNPTPHTPHPTPQTRDGNLEWLLLQAMILLIRVITGENWETTMRDCAIEWPMCTSDLEAQLATGEAKMIGDCGNTVISFLLFDTFFMVAAHILFNLNPKP
jgi:hypothetical protein